MAQVQEIRIKLTNGINIKLKQRQDLCYVNKKKLVNLVVYQRKHPDFPLTTVQGRLLGFLDPNVHLLSIDGEIIDVNYIDVIGWYYEYT